MCEGLTTKRIIPDYVLIEPPEPYVFTWETRPVCCKYVSITNTKYEYSLWWTHISGEQNFDVRGNCLYPRQGVTHMSRGIWSCIFQGIEMLQHQLFFISEFIFCSFGVQLVLLNIKVNAEVHALAREFYFCARLT